uniref:Protein HGH1 N-terminal domain-containing protein n=1 Tax=Glossina palpalis gambiensis TaxID=67801 RepID=A0A1B0BXG0_9MUSC
MPGYELITSAIRHIINENSNFADSWSMVLSNMTREEFIAYGTLDISDENSAIVMQLMNAFAKLLYNKTKAKLDYLEQIFSNLTQTHRGQELLCRSKYNLLNKILPFSTYEQSLTSRNNLKRT